MVNCDFYNNLVKDPTKIATFVEDQNLPQYDRVFIPIREGPQTFLVVLNDNVLEYYDPMAGKTGGDAVAKNFVKFFKDFTKTAKKDSQAKKGISHKKWDNLKFQNMFENQVQKKTFRWCCTNDGHRVFNI